MQRRRWRCWCDDSSDDPGTSAATAASSKVESPHPRVELLLSQRSLSWMERSQELGVP